MAPELKLLSLWASPYCMRVAIALNMKKVQCEVIEEDLRNKSDLLIKLNPVHKKVPVLIHNGKPICESLIIVEYVDEVWPEDGTRQAILPKDAYCRAMERFWADFIDKKIFPPAYFALRKQGDEQQKAIADFYESYAILEGALAKVSEKPFFGGKKLNFVDVILAPLACWLLALEELAGINVNKCESYPRLCEYFKAVREHPAVANVLPDDKKESEHFRKLRNL
ncbi:hypothetical protein O6H91_16G044200 [Diphasiastrum complanatum]|uniref:Uncharacterized protein n=2 Tax=Diphasiastrum complanatum TaxID=34168 RepID=A0ACC2BAC1_DIPCM|nr:hypothetical protein O6H91_16G019900 [Diphasiastrum complanatum]KAJ7527244.1 hypothetical protein O6H91_16G044200 [Diphasiastrum complanatum]